MPDIETTETDTDSGTETTETDTAPAPPAKGYPESTPVAEMTPEQQAAYWKTQARKHEERSRSRADYDDLKAKAVEFDKLTEAQKSEAQKLADAKAAAEKQAADTAAELARVKAAVKHGLTEEDLELLGTGTPEEIEARAERLAKRIGNGRKTTDFGGGDRGTDVGAKTPQITSRDELKRMTPAEIVKAKAEGRLDELLGSNK